MNVWTLRAIDQAAEVSGSNKLASFWAAREAGIRIPEGAVLVPSSLKSSRLSWLESEEDERWLDAIAAAGQGELVLRELECNPSHAHRSITVAYNDLPSLADRLAGERFPVAAQYIQARWPGTRRGSVRTLTIVIDSNGSGPSIAYAYQTSLDGSASPFDKGDACWNVVAETCNRISLAIGFSAQIVIGLLDDEATLLSVRRAPLPLAGQIRTSAALAENCPSSRGATVAAIADALDELGNRYYMPERGGPLATIRGRSIGESWTTGRIALTPAAQAMISTEGDPVIFVRSVLRAEDCDMLRKAAGVVSLMDGVSSHYALLASSLRKACLVDLSEAAIETSLGAIVNANFTLREGDWATIDEREGILFPGRARSLGDQIDLPASVVEWAHSLRESGIFVNCEEPDTGTALNIFGADGIGLCRSERHLVSSHKGLVALQAVVSLADCQERDGAIRIVCEELGNALKTLLVATPTMPISYRLLEPAEILLEIDTRSSAGGARTAVAGPNSPAIWRGEALRNQFPFLYEEQIRTAIAAATSVAQETRSTVDLTLVIPMVSDPAEYNHWARSIREAAARLTLGLDNRVKIGVGSMIETPRAALLARELAQDADTFLIGTNDLTALVWGINRFDTVRRSSGEDPFTHFDINGVGRLVERAIREGREANPQLKITICGSHASLRLNSDALLDTGADGVSCQIDAVPRIALQLARRAEHRKGRRYAGLPAKSRATQLSVNAFAAATNSIPSLPAGGPNLAFASLSEWAKGIADDLRLPWTGIWKFFKRDLVAKVFGPREARRFLPGWQLEPALEYALSVGKRFDTRIRCSVFPADIACRSWSEVFPTSVIPQDWQTLLQRLDPEISIEIFPQQPVNRTAFRAVLRDMVLAIEGAQGQAIDVFWKSPQLLSKFHYDGLREQICELSGTRGFDAPFRQHLRMLFAQCQSLRDYLGAEWISLEGYAGPGLDQSLFIADLDLPLDSVLVDASGSNLTVDALV